MLRLRALWSALGAAFVVIVIYLSLTRDPLPAVDSFGFDFGHALAYAWLMYWFAMIERTQWQQLRIGLALSALGIGLEVVQGMTGYRVFSWADMRDNAVGVAIGAIAARTRLGLLLPWVDARLARYRTSG